MKTCTKCGIEKSLNDFCNHKKRKDGKNGWCRSCCNKYGQDHKESISAYKKKWNQNNKEAIETHNKKYHQDHKKSISANVKQWRQENPEKHNACNQRRRARKKNAPGHFTGEELKELKAKYAKCLCCGAATKPLSADHIVPLIKGGSNFISNIQPLCQSCNCSKHDKIIDYRPVEDRNHFVDDRDIALDEGIVL